MLEPPVEARAGGAVTSSPVATARADSPAVSRLRTTFPFHCDFTDVTRGSVPDHERTVAQPADRYRSVTRCGAGRADHRPLVITLCAAVPVSYTAATQRYRRSTAPLSDTALDRKRGG